MRRRKYLSIILILIMLFTIFITTAAAEEVNTEQEDKTSENEEEIIGRIETPTNVNDLLNFFQRLQGNWIIYENGEKVQDSTISYQYLSKDNVMGEEADKISLKVNETNSSELMMYFWVGENEILQMELDGQIIPKQMVDMMKDDLLSSVFAAFTMYQELDIERLRKYGKTSRGTEEFGGVELDIIKIEAENIAETDLESGVVKLADFEDFLIVVEYEYKALNGDQKVEFIVQDIKMR